MRIRFTLLLILIGQQLIGQEQLVLTKKDGLPSNVVYQVFQDHLKFLWVTTDNGVARYDGQEFMHFNLSDGLASDENYELFETPDNLLVLAGSNGQLSVYDRLNQSFVPLKTPLNSFVSQISFLSKDEWLVSSYGDGYIVGESSKKTRIQQSEIEQKCPISFVWTKNEKYCFINNCGVYRINKDGTHSVIFEFEEDILFSRACETPEGVLFSGRNNMYFIDNDEVVHRLNSAEEITSKTINRIQQIDEKFFASTYRGVVIFTVNDNSIIIEDHLLKDQVITSVQKDHENSYWFSSLRNGLFKIPDIALKQLSEKETYEISVFNNEIFVGCDNFSFMSFNHDTLVFHRPTYKHEYSTPRVKKVKKIGAEIWLEIDGGLVKWSENQSEFYNTSVAYISEFDDQYVVGNLRGLYVLSKKEMDTVKVSNSNIPLFELKPLPLNKIKTTGIEKSQESLLIGSTEGVYRFNGSLKKISSLPSLNVSKIEILGKKEYIIYEKAGVIELDSNNHKLVFDQTKFKEQPRCLLPVKKGLLIGTNNGIMFFDDKGVFLHKLPFLQSTEINDLEMIGEELLISSEIGLYSHVFPFVMNKDYEVPIQKTTIYVNDNLLSGEEGLSLEYWNNNVLVQFKTINFSPCFKLYRLNKGSWTDFQDEIRFSELKPGDYSVEVKYGDDYTQKSTEITSFIIHPPWWSTTWFKLSLIFGLIIIIYAFFKIRILTYNRDIVRELMMMILNYFKTEKFILVKDVKDGSQTKIIISSLDYLESSKNYVTLYHKNSKIVIRSSLKEIQSRLNKEGQFLRCHRSFVVNSKKITAVHGDFVKIRDRKIPIGPNYLNTIDEKLNLLQK